TPTASGNTTIKSRAVDDSGNLETPSAGILVIVGPGCGLGGFELTPILPLLLWLRGRRGVSRRNKLDQRDGRLLRAR
ncbi:MAG TPA: hypothetical protein VKM54_26755, partial [Myxococcota bacterium]|nr:hypothetical protein [Myxococcota bacterium]